MKRGRTTLTEIKWADILSPALGDAAACCWHCISTPCGRPAQPPRVPFRADSSFSNKQAHKYISILNLIQVKSVPSKPFKSPVRLFCSTYGQHLQPKPLSLLGTWPCITNTFPVFQTKDSFQSLAYLLLATLAIALEGKMLKMESRAVQFRCPTATLGLASLQMTRQSPCARLMTISPNCRTGFKYLRINHSGCWINRIDTSEQRPDPLLIRGSEIFPTLIAALPLQIPGYETDHICSPHFPGCHFRILWWLLPTLKTWARRLYLQVNVKL